MIQKIQPQFGGWKNYESPCSPAIDQLIDEVRDTAKSCFPNLTIIDLFARSIKETNKFVCNLKIKEIFGK